MNNVHLKVLKLWCRRNLHSFLSKLFLFVGCRIMEIGYTEVLSTLMNSGVGEFKTWEILVKNAVFLGK